MIRVYQTGSLAAQLQLTAISYAHGVIIRQGLEWFVTRIGAEGAATDDVERSDQPIAHFDLKPGTYLLQVSHLDEVTDLGTVDLDRNTLADCVFILQNSAPFDEEAEYFAESDAEIEYKRRMDDRNIEARDGNIVTPLKNPHQEKGQGMQFQTHPLLAQKAQFDGMPETINMDPQKNEAAMEKQLQLQLELQMQNANQNNMTPPSPTAPG